MVVLQGHVYTAGGRLYKQVLGGPIGLALTTLIAEILMRKFDLKFEKYSFCRIQTYDLIWCELNI